MHHLQRLRTATRWEWHVSPLPLTNTPTQAICRKGDHRESGRARSLMRVAIYARVSANNGQDPTMQTRELKEYIERRGWKLAGEYVDVGISGSQEKRPELDRV